MTARELSALIGKRGKFSGLNGQGMWFLVEILDAKHTYGRTRYLVRPIAGHGETWTESVVVFDNEEG